MTTTADGLRRLCRDNGVLDQDSASMIARYLGVGELTEADHAELAALSPVERSGVLTLRYGSDASRLALLVHAKATS